MYLNCYQNYWTPSIVIWTAIHTWHLCNIIKIACKCMVPLQCIRCCCWKWQSFQKHFKPMCVKSFWYSLYANLEISVYLYHLSITLTLLDLTKSYKNYLQNTQHVVLRNRPTLPIGTERLACLNSPRGVQLVTLASPSTRQVPGSSPGPGGRAACAFFLHPPFLPPSGEFFSHLPHETCG